MTSTLRSLKTPCFGSISILTISLFHLTGILYFHKLKNQVKIQKDKIQLYQNQIYVIKNFEDIVPEFITLLCGVID